MHIAYPKVHAALGFANILATVACAATGEYGFACFCAAVAALNLALWRAAT